jgi:ribosomal RNA assembly protein
MPSQKKPKALKKQKRSTTSAIKKFKTEAVSKNIADASASNTLAIDTSLINRELQEQNPNKQSEKLYFYQLKIPKARIAPLIGRSGSTKRKLCKRSECEIEVDSEEGEVKISGKDPLKLFDLKNVVSSIGRGVNPDIAQALFDKENFLEIINIADFAGTKKSMIRLRGRVIGDQGKARKTIEQLTQTKICVFGKTIAIIGKVFDVKNAKDAMISLLQGSQHANVYSYLEKKRKIRKEEDYIDESEIKFKDESEKEFFRDSY